MWLFVRGREVVVSGRCNMCGRCCRGLNLTLGDRGGWIRSKHLFELAKKQHPAYERFEITGRTPTGILIFKCKMLDENNLCGDHENRPGYCRTYPTPDLYFMGGELLPGCGFRFEVVPRFNRILKQSVNTDGGDPPRFNHDS